MYSQVVLFIGIILTAGLHGSQAARYELKKADKTCIIIDSEILVNVVYFNTEGKQATASWALGPATAVSGECDTDSPNGQASSVNLTFAGHWVSMQFANSSGRVSLAAVSLSVDVTNGSRFQSPNATGVRLLTAKPGLELSSDTQCFACASALQLGFAEAPAGSGLTATGTKLQAFGVRDGKFSDGVETCAADATTAETGTTPAALTTSSAAPPPPVTTAPSTPPLLNLTVLDPVTGAPCLRLQLRASFAIAYSQTSGANLTATVPVPSDGLTVSGQCGNASQSVRLQFFGGTWVTDITFAKLDAGGYGLRYLQLWYQVTADRFPGAANLGKNLSAVGNNTYFSVASGSGDYYMCSAKQQYRLDAGVAMETQDLRAQAFRTNNGTDLFYGAAVDCLDDTPIDNVVPIVVGSALAGLVLIVLVAYLIGRRRQSSGGGYQSV